MGTSGINADRQRSYLHRIVPRRAFCNGDRNVLIRHCHETWQALSPSNSGQIERFHKTLKRWLRKQKPAGSIEELQAQIDYFVKYYNEVRPHSAKDMMTPLEAWNALDKAALSSTNASSHHKRECVTTRSIALAFSHCDITASCTTPAWAEHSRASD